MCYCLVERYAVCGCVYYTHAVDQCAAYNQYGHKVQEKTILVGYACTYHTSNPQSSYGSGAHTYSDSGYYSVQSSSSQSPSKR